MLVNPLAELPLAIFSTLMPLSVGSFVAIAVVVFSDTLDDKLSKVIRRSISVPLVLLGIGFIAAFFHLSTPLNAVYVLSGIGRSPLASEIAAVSLYTVLAVAYFVVEMVKMKCVAFRKCLLVAVLASGLVASVFTGAAYYVETIAGWASVWPAVEQMGYLLMGTLIGLSALKVFGEGNSTKLESIVCIFAVCGLCIAVFAGGAHLFQVANMTCYTMSGSELSSQSALYALTALVVGSIGVLCAIIARVRTMEKTLYLVSSAFVLLSVFLARLSFYCLQLGVGL